MTLKIGVLGLTSNKNIGDYLLAEATKYLLKEYSEKLIIVDIDIDPRGPDSHPGIRKLNLKLYNGMRVLQPFLFSILRSRYLQYLYQYLYWHLKLNWHYKRSLRGLDAIVFSGGGFIKFRTQGLNYLDEQILKIANKRCIPVMMSAVGVEGFDEKDVRCLKLKQSLNLPVVKVITTRDDHETLRSKYIVRKEIVTDRVADPVLWLNSMLGKPNRSPEKLIGVNLVNPSNFRDYGGKMSGDQVLNFYKNLISELQIRKQPFVLFTNGMQADVKFGQRLLRDMNLSASSLLPAPETSKELISDLLRFDIILAARMHAGIVATALGVPTIGLIWGEKIELFARVYGIRPNYFAEAEMDPGLIASLLADRNAQQPDQATLENLRRGTSEYLHKFLDSLGAKVAS